jgi:hypothetical protein
VSRKIQVFHLTAFVLRACHHAHLSPILQPSRKKVLIRLGKSLFLGSGKATTRVKRRITAAFEGIEPPNRIPTRATRGNSAAPLKLAEA